MRHLWPEARIHLALNDMFTVEEAIELLESQKKKES